MPGGIGENIHTVSRNPRYVFSHTGGDGPGGKKTENRWLPLGASTQMFEWNITGCRAVEGRGRRLF